MQMFEELHAAGEPQFDHPLIEFWMWLWPLPWAFAPPEIEIKDQKCLEILKSTAFIFRIIDLVLAMTVYLPV